MKFLRIMEHNHKILKVSANQIWIGKSSFYFIISLLDGAHLELKTILIFWPKFVVSKHDRQILN